MPSIFKAMKTILISLITTICLSLNLVAAKHTENKDADSKLKQSIAFSITTEDVSENAAATETGELERNDIATIAFMNTIDQVSESANHTDIEELNQRTRVSFKINIQDVIEKMNVNQSMDELTNPGVAYLLTIKDVLGNSANADLSELITGTSPVAFSLNIAQVSNYANEADTDELTIDGTFLAENQ
jgi:hypothetical protein